MKGIVNKAIWVGCGALALACLTGFIEVGPKATEQWHTVHYGETLGEIAEEYNTTVYDIIANNPGSSEVITEGQQLRIVTYER